MPRYNSSKRSGQRYEFLRRVILSKIFNLKAEELRKKWNVQPAEIANDLNQGGHMIEEVLWDEVFEDDVVQLIKDCKLPLRWRTAIGQYILDGGMSNVEYQDVNAISSGVLMTPEGDDWFRIEVGPDSTYTDLEVAWEAIKDFKDQPIRKDRDKKNARRDILIFQLHRRGKTANEIRQILKTEHGYSASESVIYKVVSEIKNQD